MVYQVIKAFEFEGRTYLPGQLVKLNKEQLALYKRYIQVAKRLNKDFMNR